MTDYFSTKEYKTMGGFLRGVRAALRKVFGNDDDLTLVERGESRTVEERIRNYENVSCCEGDDEYGYKWGFEFEYPDRIYVYYEKKEGLDWIENF